MARRGTVTIAKRADQGVPLDAVQNDANLTNLRAGILKSSEVAADGAYHSVIADDGDVGTNAAPSTYLPGSYHETKTGAALALPGAVTGTVHLHTLKEKVDTGDARAHQVAHAVTGRAYYRSSTSAAAWGSWKSFGFKEELDAHAADAGDPHAAAGYLKTADLPAATVSQSGIVELATDAEAAAGADNTRAVTPTGVAAAIAALAGASDLSPTGYATMPGGLIFQWGITGTITGGDTPFTVTFPVPFPSAAFHANYIAQTSEIDTANENGFNSSVTALAANAFDGVNRQLNGTKFYWFAIGF